jgi:hypothetical protein
VTVVSIVLLMSGSGLNNSFDKYIKML